ncbi:MAG: GGDEF domain-containing protein [Butyrivibrio sp.]|nr:GGDEF domain-containing protein [Butyrivibrio sp.]
MKLWNYRRLEKLIPAFVLIAIVAFVILSSNKFFVSSTSRYALDDGWTITFKGDRLESTTLSNSGVGIVDAGEIVTISGTLPDVGINNPCGSMYTIHAVVDVYLDGKMIYTYGREYRENKKSVPRHLNVFPLGSDYAGKKLTIILTGSRIHSFSGLSTVIIGDKNSLFIERILSMRRNIVIGAFLIVLGVILMALSPYMFLYHNNDFRLFFSGFISLMLGLYTYSFYGIIDLITDNSRLNMIMEYSSLYNIPTAIIGYFMSVYKGNLKKAFRFLFVLNTIVYCIVFLFCVFGRGRIYEYTPILHSMAGSEGAFAVAMIIKTFIGSYKNKKKRLVPSDNVFAFGLLLLMMMSILDIIKYNYRKLTPDISDSLATINGFMFGSLIFVSGLLISYMLYVIYNSDLDTMQNKISSLAYTDPLTGLANRARCEQVMEMLTSEHGPYTIISLDLNKLKEVNDNLGHHEGDRLIAGFATILSDSFWDANLVGRMGGDEFIVVLTEDRALNCTRRIHNLYSMINDWNRKEQRFQYSASYGYAYSYEVPSGSAQEVYMLADNRMYEMKREHQNSLAKGGIVHA